MSLISLVLTLVVIGVLLWALNKFGSQFIEANILKIINIVVIVAVVLWVLFKFIGHNDIPDIRVG